VCGPVGGHGIAARHAKRHHVGATGRHRRGGLGRVVQVKPTKPVFKAPGTELLKLRCDEPLSCFAFNFNLRRYSSASATLAADVDWRVGDKVVLASSAHNPDEAEVRRCRLTL